MSNNLSPPAEGSLSDRFAPSGEMLSQVEQQRKVFAQMLRREVENSIIDARRLMSTDPDRVIQELKLTLQNVERVPELAADIRAQLMDKLQTAIRETQHAAQIKEENDAELQERQAMARERAALEQKLVRDTERERQLVERVSMLIDQGDYKQAEEVAKLLEELDPEGATPTAAVLQTRFVHQYNDVMVVRADRWRYWNESLYQVELSSIPFPDEPPILYPPAEVWRALTIRRKDRYGSMDLRAKGDAEERIERALRDPLHDRGLDFNGTSLEDVINEISTEYGIPIQLDNQALDAAGLGPNDPVTINIRGISLRSALNNMLRQLKLTYIIQDEIMLITTPEEAEQHLVVKVYPVADLVLPIQSGIGGGIGGGFGGGGLGGGGLGGGGFGGGGLGGGGLGGGGFGGGGLGGGGLGGGGFGGGGGLFSVPDADVSTSDPASRPAMASDAVIGAAATQSTQLAAAAGKAVSAAQAVSVPKSANPDAFWEDYFSHQSADRAGIRETVRQLMGSRRYDQVVALVQAALRHGQSQPWMYETLGIAMELVGRPKSEIERAVMSAADFSSSPEELMFVARYLSRIGIDRRAMKVYQQIAKLEPLRAEPYALGLQAAQECDDLAGIEWATIGVLRQAWPAEQAQVQLKATRVAQATLARLASEGKTAELEAYRTAPAGRRGARRRGSRFLDRQCGRRHGRRRADRHDLLGCAAAHAGRRRVARRLVY